MTRATPPADRNRRFAGRRVYLTGAASGIGRATARLLARDGAALALVDLDRDGLDSVAAETGGQAFAVDLRDGSAIDRSVAEAGERLGGLDGIVNCAGVAVRAPLEDLTPEQWERAIAVNLTAPFRICRAAIPLLRASPASAIVNVASGVALVPTGPGSAAYIASKGGLVSFTRALAIELGPNVRANVVCPGLTDTPMVDELLGGPPEQTASYVGQYVMKRAGDPAEIAEAIGFLLSDEASFITGITFSADGGRSFH